MLDRKRKDPVKLTLKIEISVLGSVDIHFEAMTVAARCQLAA